MSNKNFRVKNGLDIGDGISISDAGVVDGLDTDNLDEGTTNRYYTETRVDANFATKTTTSLAEGTNLYYTDARARGAVSATDTGGDGSLSYNSGTGVLTYTGPSPTEVRAHFSSGTGVTITNGSVAIGQAVGTTDDVVFDTVDANITDDNYVLGQLVATRNTAYVPPASALTTIAGQNGIVVSSNSGGLGYGAAVAVRYHSGDTTAGTNNASAIQQSGASGTSSAPGGVSINQVLGANNFDGYTAGTSNNYASQIATANQGAGTTSLQPLQAQAYARQAFTNSTTVTTAVTGASGTGTTATLTFTTQNTAPYTVGQSVTVAGMTPSGYNGTYTITASTTSSISYANATTGFTTGGTIAAANTVTAAGTGFRIRGFANSTAMTPANRFNFMDLTASAATFKSNAYTFANEVITGSTVTATNYMTLASTGITMGNVDGITNFIRTSGANTGTRPVAFLRNSVTATTTPATNDGASFRLQAAGSNGTGYNLAQISGTYSTTGDTSISFDVANGDQNTSTMTSLRLLETKLSGTVIKAVATPTATPGGNTLTDVATFSATKILNSVPHRSAVTTASIARGSTYTPAAGVNNFIELTLTAGTDPTYIDVDNLTVAGEGGHQAILVYNNSGSTVGNGDLRIRNNGTQISDNTGTTVANGARIIFTVYCVGNYASCEYMTAA